MLSSDASILRMDGSSIIMGESDGITTLIGNNNGGDDTQTVRSFVNVQQDSIEIGVNDNDTVTGSIFVNSGGEFVISNNYNTISIGATPGTSGDAKHFFDIAAANILFGMSDEDTIYSSFEIASNGNITLSQGTNENGVILLGDATGQTAGGPGPRAYVTVATDSASLGVYDDATENNAYVAVTNGHLIQLSSDYNGVLFPRIITAQRNALTPSNGTVIYNIDNARFEFYQNDGWVFFTANAA